VCMHKGYSRRITSFPLPDIEFAVPKLFRDVEDRSAVHSEQGGSLGKSNGVLPKHEDLGTRRRWVDVQMGDRSPFDS